MEFTIKITKKDVLIGFLTLALITVMFSKFEHSGDSSDDKIETAHYGILDGNVHYNVVNDQINDLSMVYAELVKESDTLEVGKYTYLKIDSTLTLTEKIKPLMFTPVIISKSKKSK